MDARADRCRRAGVPTMGAARFRAAGRRRTGGITGRSSAWCPGRRLRDPRTAGPSDSVARRAFVTPMTPAGGVKGEPMAITTGASIEDVVDTVIAEARRTQMHRTVMEAAGAHLPRDPRRRRHAGDSKVRDGHGRRPHRGVDMTTRRRSLPPRSRSRPAEVGAQIVITDRALRTAQEDMARAAGRVLGDAVAKKLDADLLGLLDGFSTSLARPAPASPWGTCAPRCRGCTPPPSPPPCPTTGCCIPIRA